MKPGKQDPAPAPEEQAVGPVAGGGGLGGSDGGVAVEGEAEAAPAIPAAPSMASVDGELPQDHVPAPEAVGPAAGGGGMGGDDTGNAAEEGETVLKEEEGEWAKLLK